MSESPVRYAEFAPRPPEEGDIDLRAIFSSAGPFELDVGFGRGNSILSRLAYRQDAHVLGVEVKAKLVSRVDERLRKRSLERARVWFVDVKELLPRLREDGILRAVFVHFPDPWWKKRHQKRLVVGDFFVAEVARLLAPGGVLFVQTDVPERAEEYRQTIEACGAFAVEAVETNPFESISNRELRAAEDGLPVYRLVATKVE